MNFLGILMTLFSANIVLAENVEMKEFNSLGLTEVQVENMSGHVTLNTSQDGKVTVKSTKNKFSEKCKMTIEKIDKKLLVKVEKNGMLNLAECDVKFEMIVPKTINVNVDIGSGDLNINGLMGELQFTTGSGDVAAEGDFKKISGKTGSGNIEIKGLSVGGDLIAGSGDIKLNFTTTKLSGKIDISTGSGDATLFFPKGSLIKADLKTGSGELVNELGDSSKATFKVSAKTGSGDLKVKAY